LKAPLRGIEGYSRLLAEDHTNQLDEEGLSFLQIIRQATTQMNDLIEDLLSYSRLERRTFNSESVDLRSLIDQILIEKKIEIHKRKVNIQIKGDKSNVRVDVKALEQAVRNLLDNAFKFTQNVDSPEIRIRFAEEDESIVLSIEDNGIGFDMKYSERIFDIFQRLHLQDDYPGTGIGLALVKKAMQRIGGDCWAESKAGEGASFFLRIPKGV